MKRQHPPHFERFYSDLGLRVKELRKKKGYTQEDMISFGFGVRHWQQIEAGYPINIWTLLRICEALGVRMWQLVKGLDESFPKRRARDIDPLKR